jgi:hypothetical protein
MFKIFSSLKGFLLYNFYGEGDMSIIGIRFAESYHYDGDGFGDSFECGAYEGDANGCGYGSEIGNGYGIGDEYIGDEGNGKITTRLFYTTGTKE